jgi:hypothetical protein
MSPRPSGTGFLLLLTLTAIAGCSRTPELRLNARRLTTAEILAGSSLAIVGKVVEIVSFGKETKTVQGIRVRMYRVAVEPEYNIKGDVKEKVLFYLYDYAPSVVQNGDFEWLAKGDRRLLFLNYDGEIIRSVADLYGTSMLVRRPGTPDLRSYLQSPLGERIARFFLTPAADEQARSFAETIPRATPDALKAAGYEFVAALLQSLMREGPVEVRDEACLAYYEQLFGDEACLTRIEASGGNLAHRAIQARQHREYLRTLLAEAVRSGIGSPLAHCSITGVEPNDLKSRVNFFHYLAKNPDPVIRLGAERELTRSVPKEPNKR